MSLRQRLQSRPASLAFAAIPPAVGEAALARRRLPTATVQGTAAGLDSEEAAIIHRQDRSALGAERGQADEDVGARVLVVEEPEDGTRR